jgi:uncharacterized protein YjbI with pentapeptide repeats
MAAEQPIRIERTKRRVEADDADLSGSTFTNVNLSGVAFHDVNLSGATLREANLTGLRISQANLRNAAIVDSHTDGMTINGIALADLLAAWRAGNPKQE